MGDVFDKVETYGQCQFPAGKDGATDDYFCFVNADSACEDKVPYGDEEEGLFLTTLACKDPDTPLPEFLDSLGLSNGDFLAPTDAMANPDMALAMAMADTIVVDTEVPASIVAPATDPNGDMSATGLVMALAIMVPAIMVPAMAVTIIMDPAMAVTTIMDPAMAVTTIMDPA